MRKTFIIISILFLLLCAGLVIYREKTEPKRELARAYEALKIINDLRRHADGYQKTHGFRPMEILDIREPVKSTYYFVYQYNKNGSNAYRVPMYEKYRLHNIYPEHKGQVKDSIICDVYDAEYDYICLGLGGTLFTKNPDAYALRRYILPKE